jgi:hypothetical protein
MELYSYNMVLLIKKFNSMLHTQNNDIWHENTPKKKAT